MHQRPSFNGGVEATSLHPAIEYQRGPRFYRLPPPPPPYDPGWSDGPRRKKRQKLFTNPWFWIALLEIIVISSLVVLLVLG